jgi:hypothetical protein
MRLAIALSHRVFSVEKTRRDLSEATAARFAAVNSSIQLPPPSTIAPKPCQRCPSNCIMRNCFMKR